MKKFVISLILLSLSACSVFPNKSPKLSAKPKLNIDSGISFESLNDVEFLVIEKNSCSDKFKNKNVMIGLTVDNYKNLTINEAILKNYIILQKEVISNYKKYYEEEN